MRLLIVGTLKGQLTTATKLAMEKGASLTHADQIEQALAVLRSGRDADLIMADAAIDIRDLVLRLGAEHIHMPIVACGTSNDARAAVAAIHRAVLLTTGNEIGTVAILMPEGARLDQLATIAHATMAAEAVTRALVGRTVADVERDLILETLKHCLGNRTHAANILGISIRTLRNKLNEYADDGVPIPPPGGSEVRGAA